MNVENKKKIFTLLSQGHQQHCWLRSGDTSGRAGTCTCIIGQVEALLSEEDVLNMNDQATVELTEYGKQIYHADQVKWRSKDGRAINKSLNTPVEPVIITTELWRLFAIFGPTMHMGMIEVPFQDNKIKLVSH